MTTTTQLPRKNYEFLLLLKRITMQQSFDLGIYNAPSGSEFSHSNQDQIYGC